MTTTTPPAATHTTNANDQQQAAALQARLRNAPAVYRSASELNTQLPSVVIADGAHKYVLLSAQTADGTEQWIVTSKRGASYHRNAAEPMIVAMEEAGYTDIEVTGGGRIYYQEDERKISIFGHSYGFGLANHARSRRVVLEDPRYQDCEVTISDEGY